MESFEFSHLLLRDSPRINHSHSTVKNAYLHIIFFKDFPTAAIVKADQVGRF